MREQLMYWRCPKCLGTGKIICSYQRHEYVLMCEECDGTGNGLVDGHARAHARRISAIEERAARVAKEQES